MLEMSRGGYAMRFPLQFLAVAALGAALAGTLPGAAEAAQDPALQMVRDGRHYDRYHGPPPRRYYGPPPRYYAPPPRVYYPPPPRYYAPPPRVYYPPPPRYYAPPPPGVGLYFRF
jgi:hypothetical protein